MRSLRWLMQRRVELLVLLLGIVLRLSMTWNYHATWSYDSDQHWDLVEWMASHGKVPPPEATFEAFHPPLYYASAAWLLKHGVTRSHMVWVSIVCGIVRLGVIWALFELFLPRSRWARIFGLLLAALVCISIQVDGMVYSEALSCLLNAIAILLLALAARHSGRARWTLAIVLGLVLGLAFLTKASGLVLIATTGALAFLEFVMLERPWRERVRQALPWATAVVISVSVSGWYYARNIREYGQPLITSFDLPSQSGYVAATNKQAWVDRRTLGFFVGWDPGLYLFPFGISHVGSHPRFFPVAVVSTFVDFWGYGFQGFDKNSDRKSARPSHGSREPYMRVAILAAIGGTIIFASTLVAWLAVAWRAVKDRDTVLLALMLVPFIGTLAALHFATKFPIDDLGVVKGAYLTFMAPPLYALYGVAVAWAKARWHRWPVLGVLVLALYFIASYSVECRLHFPIVPRLL